MSHDLTNEELESLRNWHRVNEKIKKFCTHSSAYTFETIFKKYDEDGNVIEQEAGEQSEGYRLFQHFRFSCNQDYEKFLTYLDVDQHNALLVHIMKLKT